MERSGTRTGAVPMKFSRWSLVWNSAQRQKRGSHGIRAQKVCTKIHKFCVSYLTQESMMQSCGINAAWHLIKPRAYPVLVRLLSTRFD
jgi:hypothetical protein